MKRKIKRLFVINHDKFNFKLKTVELLKLDVGRSGRQSGRQKNLKETFMDETGRP